MGTNYYAVKKEPCLYGRVIHIGKSSAGWFFQFHDCEYFHTFNQFKTFLDERVRTGEYVIFNEYDEQIEPDRLLKLIENKQNDYHCKRNPENFTYCKNIDGYRFTDDDFC